MTIEQQHKDLEKARKKAIEWLDEFTRLASQVAPNVDLGIYLDAYPDTLSEQMGAPDFIEQFKPKKHKVEVWIARPYVVEIEALDEDDATEKVMDTLHEIDMRNGFEESPNAMHSSLAENVLDQHNYRPTALRDF